MRWWTALAAGGATFAAALAGFLYLGAGAQAGFVRVLVAARALPAGTVLTATTQDLSPQGELVRVGTAVTAADLIPQRDYAAVAGTSLLVGLQRGQLLLWHDLTPAHAAVARVLSLRLADLPAGVESGTRVDLFAVSGTQTGLVVPGANLCSTPAVAGCVVPLAASVLVTGVDPAAQTIEITVPPALVSPWLFMDATQLLWAVPAGTRICLGAERPMSVARTALAVIRRGLPALTEAGCPGRSGTAGRPIARGRAAHPSPT
ncbi:MAG TPA: SAF domain-containing protein [Verrucomicrobiae bacterium]|nr:SAF domain-containing protein [Verrucomicrobiae bacterium]